jgi:vancomycin resistance protein VanW
MVSVLLPNHIKVPLRVLQRSGSDLLSGRRFLLAPGRAIGTATTAFVSWAQVEQPIHATASAAQKVHNLQLAAARITRRAIRPGEIFSFWHWVGTPSVRRGYQTGRSITGDGVGQEVGGGLCQLSGIIHHTVLMTGLPVLERYPHSIDIYEEHERHTPLGADATVVYGYKDFRFQNNSGAVLFLQFKIDNQHLMCELWGTRPGIACQLAFEREETPTHRIARLRRIFPDQTEEVIASRYKRR